MQGLRHPDGHLDGIIGYVKRNGAITFPLVGYDTSLPQNIGLYRMLSALMLKHAHENDLLLHMSSGASHFKRLRGGKPHIEYSAIFTKHLPLYRRLPWHIIRAIMVYIGVPIVRKYKL